MANALAASKTFMWAFAGLWIVSAWRAVPGPAKGKAKDGLDKDDVAELLWELVGDR